MKSVRTFVVRYREKGRKKAPNKQAEKEENRWSLLDSANAVLSVALGIVHDDRTECRRVREPVLTLEEVVRLTVVAIFFGGFVILRACLLAWVVVMGFSWKPSVCGELLW